jgi:glycosyltransferase involved in cell wall biosynthesis
VPFVGNSKVHIVHNGIDPDRMKFPVVSRSDYGLLNDEIVIITMARMTSQKGLEFLINAFYILKKTLHKCQLKLIIAGDDLKKEVDGHDSENLYRNEIFTLIETLDLSSSVIVRKKSYDVLQLVSVCDYYVSSSLGEGFSLSIVEAMLLRLPIIATNVTGNNDAIEDNVSGILVSPENSCEISDALFTVINNHAYASDLANNAYIRANRMFSYNSMINKTISVYKKILYV